MSEDVRREREAENRKMGEHLAGMLFAPGPKDEQDRELLSAITRARLAMDGEEK